MYRGLTLIALVLLVLAALYLPISIPYDLVSIGSVMPAEEWRLIQDAGGSLSSSHQDNRSGIVSDLSNWQFERGDLSGMEVTLSPADSGRVGLGDTIVRMYSAVIQKQIIDLENSLNVKKSEQRVLVTGEKPPIVQEAESKLVFAREALVLREKEYNMAKPLLAENLISRLEFNRIENALDLAKIDIITAEKALDVANTGLKDESVDFNRSELLALERELDFLRRRNAGYVIRAPFTGVCAPIRTPGEVLILQNVETCIVTIPIKSEEMAYLSDSARVEVIDPITQRHYFGKVLRILPQTQVLDSKSVGFLTAVISPSNTHERISLGLSAKCIVHCGRLDQRKYLQRILRFRIN